MIIKPFIMILTIAMTNHDSVHMHLITSFPMAASESKCLKEIPDIMSYMHDQGREIVNIECVPYNQLNRK